MSAAAVSARWSDADFLHAAYLVAARESDDTSTQNGAVLVNPFGTVIGSGANKLPPGICKLEARLQRPAKYRYMVHAEAAAILSAARKGESTEGATLFCPYVACHDCAKLIIAAGITRVVGDERLLVLTPERWRESIELGDALLDEAGVRRSYLNVPLGGVEIVFDDNRWTP